MTGCRKTAQMLTVSVLSMMICVVMLLGTTYAWFQETVTASVMITAETLSAALLDAEGNLLGGQGNITTLSSEETEVKSVVFYEVLPGKSSTEPEGATITTLSACHDLGFGQNISDTHYDTCKYRKSEDKIYDFRRGN